MTDHSINPDVDGTAPEPGGPVPVPLDRDTAPVVFADRAAATARLDVITQDLRAIDITRDDIATAFIRAQIPDLDTELLPAEIADRIHRRRTELHLPERDYRTQVVPAVWSTPAGLLIWPGAFTLLLVFFFGLAGVIAVLSPDLVLPLDGWGLAMLGGAFLGGAGAVAAGLALREAGGRRHPLALTEDQAVQADRARVSWPRTYNDGRWASTRLDTTQRDSVRRELFQARATTRWPEARVVGVANCLATAIRTSPAFRHDELDPYRVDLDQLVRDISLRAHRIWQVRTRANTPASPVVAEALRERRALEAEAGDAAWITLIGLLDEMVRYRAELARIERLLADIAALDHAAALDTDDTVLQLLRDAAGNELDSESLARHTDQLADLRAGLDTRLTVLRALVDNSTMPTLTHD